MKRMKYILIALALVLVTHSAAAQMIMVRSTLSFPEAMLALQNSVVKQGYTVSRVQRVDIGLTKSGFKTDKYRVLFFGKADEVERLTKKHPQLIPYLPWKIVIFAEEDETLLVTHDPVSFSTFFPDEDLKTTFKGWRKDLVQMLERVRDTEE